ncbi:hypothetical protein [uncultured Mediterranea sp.]|nr:hypothetical protein [uncultured Mediterranea sp.]
MRCHLVQHEIVSYAAIPSEFRFVASDAAVDTLPEEPEKYQLPHHFSA